MSELSSLIFPRNVYASLLEWETGLAGQLHYGFFEHAAEPFLQAQERAVELLLAYLPAEGSILEVGCGFGGLTALLAASGRQVTGINVDAAQLAMARMRHGNDLSFRCTPFESFHEQEGAWDIILFHESAQYISMLDLLERTDALLKEHGELLILDEWALRRVVSGKEGLHLKQHFIDLAGRFGFTCALNLDLSAGAVPAIDFLTEALLKHRDRLGALPGVTPAAIDRLIVANRQYQDHYKTGRFGYALLHFTRTQRPGWRVGRIRPAHGQAVQRLFCEVFGLPLTPEHWHWKYGDGRGAAVGVWKDGELVAHYGGLPRRINYFGRREQAMQSVDAMVASKARGAFTRKGAFFLATATHFEQYMGYGTPHLIGYGFPNQRALQLPLKLGLYVTPIAHINELVWEPSTVRNMFWYQLRELQGNNHADHHAIDLLWHEMEAESEDLIIGVRDAAYWIHRYMQHPCIGYRNIMVYHRFLRRPCAVFACRQDGDRLELLDWVSRRTYLPGVIEAARMTAYQTGSRELYCWASEPLQEVVVAQVPPLRIVDTGIEVPTNGWTAGPAIAEIAGRIWLTGGDTDFK
ncbi:MAG: bifunctional class I SAM-dependent methyltransferase/GNAT family N-acetyltransferase [Deltaproteobacteria bacterium]|nr:bifunctional class I SAM-dependent methyltransferase/GNAT family N-acetyltransferase [Deltaproteobacteria bacterium]